MGNILELITDLFNTLICEERYWMLIHDTSYNDWDMWRITIGGGDTNLIALLETKLIDAKVDYRMVYDPNKVEYYILIEVRKEKAREQY